MVSLMLRYIIVIFNATKGTVAFAYLYDLKYSKWFTVPVFFFWQLLSSMNNEFYFFTNLSQFILFIWVTAIYIFLLEGDIINNLILSVCFEIIFSAGVMAGIAVVSKAYHLLSHSKQTVWFGGPGMTINDFWIYIFCGLVFIYLAYRICKDVIKPLIPTFSKVIRWSLFFGLYVTSSLIRIFAFFSYTTKEQQVGSTIVIWGYGLLIICALALSIFIIIVVINRINNEQAILDKEMRSQIQNYKKMQSVLENLREVKHDLANMMVAGGENYKSSILQYCDNIRKEVQVIKADSRSSEGN